MEKLHAPLGDDDYGHRYDDDDDYDDDDNDYDDDDIDDGDDDDAKRKESRTVP